MFNSLLNGYSIDKFYTIIYSYIEITKINQRGKI